MGRDDQNHKRRKNFPIRLLGSARKELSDLDAINRAEFLVAIDVFELHGPGSGVPNVEKIGGDMYELKTHSRSHWLRGFYFHYVDGLYIVTHILPRKPIRHLIPAKHSDYVGIKISSVLRVRNKLATKRGCYEK